MYTFCTHSPSWSYYYPWSIEATQIPFITIMVNNRPCQRGDNSAACSGYTGQKFRASQDFVVPPSANPVRSLRFEIPPGILLDIAEDVKTGRDRTVDSGLRNGAIFTDPQHTGLNGTKYYFGNPQNASTAFPVTIYFSS